MVRNGRRVKCRQNIKQTETIIYLYSPLRQTFKREKREKVEYILNFGVIF